MPERNTVTTDPDVLHTPNGIVDLRTGNWDPSTDQPQVSPCTAVDPADDPFACHRWLSFLSEVSGGDASTADLIGRFMGYSLSGHTSEQLMLSLHGPMDTGKTTLMNIWVHIMGGYAFRSGPSALHRGSNLYALGVFEGKRLVHMCDVSMPGGLPPETLKMLISDDEIVAEIKYGPVFYYRPQFKIAMDHNVPLWFHKDDETAKRRVRTVSMSHAPAVRDPDLSAALRLEAPSILRWMIGKHLQWRDSGLAAMPDPGVPVGIAA